MQNRREATKKMIVDLALRFGDFTLRSGQKSSWYVDKYQFEAAPAVLKNISVLLMPLVPAYADVLAGLELGGVPLATALSLELVLPVAFVRKEAKIYGTCQINEGAAVKGMRTCVIEDIVTTGGQVLKSVADLRAAGAIVDTVVCVVLRGGPEVEATFKQHDLTLAPLFRYSELEAQIEQKRAEEQQRFESSLPDGEDIDGV